MEEKLEKQTIEEMFEALSDLVDRMDSDNMPLEEAFACYEKGVGLVKEARARLAQTEQRILQISEDGEIHEFQ